MKSGRCYEKSVRVAFCTHVYGKGRGGICKCGVLASVCANYEAVKVGFLCTVKGIVVEYLILC